MTREQFEEKFWELTPSERLDLYNAYCSEYDYDNYIHYFDENFFENAFTDKMDVCRATVFGRVNFSDEYIKFNAYGNLESLSEYDIDSQVEDYVDEIFDHEELWQEYIDDEEEEEE